MTLITFLQNIFTILSGPLGVAIVGAYIIKGIFGSMRQHRLDPFENALIGGGAFYAIAWIMSAVLPASGG